MTATPFPSPAPEPSDDGAGFPQSPLDWLVIGGGIHGVHVAARLIGEAEVDPSRLRILDPGAELLSRWRRCTATTGMSHLRSPGVHHLDLEPFSLIHFAGPRRRRPRGLLKLPYDRPSLALFNEHCDRVIERHHLRQAHLQAHATRCEIEEDGVAVNLCDGRRLNARQVILAMGAGDRPHRPPWAPRGEPRVQHVFAHDFVWPDDDGAACVVVGGGISAAQVALRAVGEGRETHMVIRGPIRVHRFDSDPGWLGPKLYPEFQRLRHPDERRGLIQRVRYRGSVTPEVHRELKQAVTAGRLELHETEVQRIDGTGDELRVVLADDQRLDAGNVLLATGFDPRRPGGRLVDELVDSADLPCAACGYPVVDPLLRWHRRIRVTGPLAELELGPVARNIAGARRAGDRLIRSLS